ncbi:Importin beta-like SAD2-like protein [Nymphaea thermarum]|nr:Importin beta-like SAD2-like protein [Nymphaea thermarum]
METLVPQVSHHLNDTLSPDEALIRSATRALDELSMLTAFPFSLIAIIRGEYDRGRKLAAATYLKNFISKVDSGRLQYSFANFRGEFRNQLVQTLLQAETEILRVLVDAYRVVLIADFVKENSWPELVPDLSSAIQNSSFISNSLSLPWKTINALTILQATIKPFKYFLNPELARESVPQQLNLIAKEIIVPLQAIFYNATEKVLFHEDGKNVETTRVLLILCKCIYLAVRSYMPSALGPTLHLWCRDFFRLLGSLNLETESSQESFLLRMKIGKRCLLIFCALKLDFLPERVMSLAFDVISHVLETGPGWRIVSPYFLSLLESAIFPALVMNNKDVSEWEEDPEEYIRKNLPSELGECSGWREELFTARKSAINLLGVMAKSKVLFSLSFDVYFYHNLLSQIQGPPLSNSRNANSAISGKRKKGVKHIKGKEGFCFIGDSLVMPFLSKYSIPLDAMTASTGISEYYGVLMAYGGLQDFLKEKNPEYTEKLVQNNVMPLYSSASCSPYLLATANWLLGELASYLPQKMNADIYNVLLKAMVMPDEDDINCYPVRMSAAAAIGELLENDYEPPEWLPLLKILVGGVNEDDENIASLMFHLLMTVVTLGDDKITCHIPMLVSAISDAIPKHVPPSPEPWPQVVEPAFAALAATSRTWVDSVPEEEDPNETAPDWKTGTATVVGALACLLQKVWLSPVQASNREIDISLPPSSCLDAVSSILGTLMKLIIDKSQLFHLRIEELLVIWSQLIAEWDAWEEMEDMAVFAAIEEVIVIVKNFTHASFSHFKGIQHKPFALWKPLLLLIGACYISDPDYVERILEKDVENGCMIWASGMACISSRSFEPSLSSRSEIKLAGLTLMAFLERRMSSSEQDAGIVGKCFAALTESLIYLKEIEDNDGESDIGMDDVTEEEEETDTDEDSNDGDEETEEEFLERYEQATSGNVDVTTIDEGDVEDQTQEIELGNI